MYQAFRVFFAAIPIIMGCFLVYNAMSMLALSKEASLWPKVAGKVLEVKSGSYFSYYSSGSRILYHYAIDGVTYAGERIAFGGGNVSAYTTDQTVDVYYNPDNKSEAVLETGVRLAYYFWILLSVALVWVGISLWSRLG
ncbi:MAG: DUF3592 domain-containing protein [Gammaproteobacteria bacterium]|nr:DUF3592 domain-containing protein [Gammaproteobacteria bacterium]